MTEKLSPSFALTKTSMSQTSGRVLFGDTPVPTWPSHPSFVLHSLFLIVMSRASCAFSNRSDEDDLPPDLAEAVGVPATTSTITTTVATTPVSAPLASPQGHRVSSPQNSEGKSQLSPGVKVWNKAWRRNCSPMKPWKTYGVLSCTS